jgi:hypothetical protein
VVGIIRITRQRFDCGYQCYRYKSGVEIRLGYGIDDDVFYISNTVCSVGCLS